MGEAANKFSTLSWPGKVKDNPKPYGRSTASKGPLTEDDLAEFEQKMLSLIQEMAEKISREQIGRDKE
jgi:threonyl-tRNA synthetase